MEWSGAGHLRRPMAMTTLQNQCWLVLGFSRIWIQVYELDPHSDLTLELNLMGLHGLKPGQELDPTSVKGFLQGLGHRVGYWLRS